MLIFQMVIEVVIGILVWFACGGITVGIANALRGSEYSFTQDDSFGDVLFWPLLLIAFCTRLISTAAMHVARLAARHAHKQTQTIMADFEANRALSPPVTGDYEERPTGSNLAMKGRIP